MRYFHRTSVPVNEVLAEADAYFGSRLAPGERTERTRVYSGSIGRIEVEVRPEGGHYTLVTIGTDQVTESEADKLVKRFMGKVHQKHEPSHELRGAY